MKKNFSSFGFSMVVGLMALATVGCGDGSMNSPSLPLSQNETVHKTSTSLSYRLIQNGCSTGEQVFDSKEALCEGLQDNGLNNFCALELRQRQFKKAACEGDFAEKNTESLATKSGPSAIRCVGSIKNSSESKVIDEVIPWDRKNPLKVVLSDFKEVGNGGEYSLQLDPVSYPGRPHSMTIFGWFMDSTKSQSVSGPLGSKLKFRHQDRSTNGRDVEIECGLVSPDVAVVSSAELNENSEISCMGSFGGMNENKDLLKAKFNWSSQPHREAVKILNVASAKERDSGIVIETEVDGAGMPSLRIVAENLDNHVQLLGSASGDLEIEAGYMSALDSSEISIHCATNKAWDLITKQTVEESNASK